MTDDKLYGNQYEIPDEKSHFIDTVKGDVLDSGDLNHFHIIKLTAQKL